MNHAKRSELERQFPLGRLERRYSGGVVRREAATGRLGGRVERADAAEAGAIVGYGAVFYDGTVNTEYELLDGYFERMLPGAFDQALRDDDVRGLFNHDPNMLLGRTSAKTMKLSIDAKGLRYEITPGDTTISRDVQEHLKRGDLSGSSISFQVLEQSWMETGEGKDSRVIREIKAVRLFDTGPVTFPSYDATTAGMRDDAPPVDAGQLDDEAGRRMRFAVNARLRAIEVGELEDAEARRRAIRERVEQVQADCRR